MGIYAWLGLPHCKKPGNLPHYRKPPFIVGETMNVSKWLVNIVTLRMCVNITSCVVFIFQKLEHKILTVPRSPMVSQMTDREQDWS